MSAMWFNFDDKNIGGIRNRKRVFDCDILARLAKVDRVMSWPT